MWLAQRDQCPIKPFDVLIESADKLLACKAEALANNWESYGQEFQLGGGV